MRGDGRVFKRGANWWIGYYAPKNGKSTEHREPGGKTEAEARKLLKARLQEIAVHRAGVRPFQGPRQEKITVDELLDALERDHEIRGRKSLRELRCHAKPIRDFFALDLALGVTADRLRDYIAHRQEEGAAAGTIKRQMGILRRSFRLAVESGVIHMAPHFPSVPDSPGRQGFFSKADFEAVLARIGDEDITDYLQWSYLTGMRPGESKSLTWADFDREEWTIRLPAHNAKIGMGRILAIEGELRAVLERRVKARRLDCPLIFHRKGNLIGDFRKRWKAACKSASVEGDCPTADGHPRHGAGGGVSECRHADFRPQDRQRISPV